MKQRMKRIVAFICATIMATSGCLVEGVFTSKAKTNAESNTVIKFNNPGIGVNVGDRIDLTKYDVQFEEGKTVEAKDLKWYGSKKTYTVPFTSPAIPANVGDKIVLSNYKVEFEKGVASTVSEWYDANNMSQKIWTLDVTEEGVYKLVAKTDGKDPKNIYIVASNTTDFVLYNNGFGKEDGYTSKVNNTDIISYNDFVNVADDPANPNYMTKIRTKKDNTKYTIDNGRLYVMRTDGVSTTIAHLLLPTWLGEFGDYRVEMKTKAADYWEGNDTWLGFDLRAQNKQNQAEGTGNDTANTAYLIQNYIAYLGEFKKGSNKSVGTDLCTGKLTYAGGSNKASTKASEISPTDDFTLVATMNGDKLTVSATQGANTYTAESNVSRTYDTGRIGIYAHHVFQYVDYIKVSLANLDLKEEVSANAEISEFTATQKGATPLTVEDKDGNKKTIYVVAKAEDETEYVLWENNFDSVTDAPVDLKEDPSADPNAFRRIYGSLNSAAVDTTSENYKGTYKIDTKSQAFYRLPTWLGEFGNYSIQMSERRTDISENDNYVGIFARGQNYEGKDKDGNDASTNYIPNYTVAIKGKYYDSDGIRLAYHRAYELDADSPNKLDYKNIIIGKSPYLEAKKFHKHEMIVQDDLVEYKLNDKTVMYDVREREHSTGYVGIMFKGSGIQARIDYIRVLFIPDIVAPNAPVSADYNRITDVAGLADGIVTVSLDPEGDAARDVVCYWGNGSDILGGYEHFGKEVVEVGATTVMVNLGNNIMIPKGATEIRVYTENHAGRSEECVCVPLPTDATPLTVGEEIMSFQVISDTHITTSETGFASKNFKAFLEKVLVNDANSQGIWIGGDLVDNGKEEEYNTFQAIWEGVEADLGKELPDMHAIIGNHEFWTETTHKGTMKAFNKFSGNDGTYFSEDVGDYHFIYLATTSLEKEGANKSHTKAVLGNTQLKWLEKTLNKNTEENKPIFIFLHQPINDTVAGSKNSGIRDAAEVTKIKEILKDYPQAVLFTSHSHMNLDTPKTMMASDEGLCNIFNTSAISYLMETHYTKQTIKTDGAQAYYVEVYEDMVLVRGKDVVSDKWLPSSQFVIFLEGYEAPAPMAPEGDEFEVDFNNYTDTKGLEKDFDAFVIDKLDDGSKEAKVEDAFVVGGQGIRRNNTIVSDDPDGFNILTYTGQQYKNFEAELVYGQSWQRYGLMFGGELGEFALNKQNGLVKATNGVAFAFTEAEGYRNVRGALTAKMPSLVNNALKRVADKLDTYVNSSGSATTNVNNEKLHTMKIRVVGDWMTMIVDDNEASRVTVRIDGYAGGYISLVSNGSTKNSGSFNSLTIKALDDNAELGCEKPEEKGGFLSLTAIKNDFDAYYLSNVEKSAIMEKVEFYNNWWFNKEGFLGRFKSGNGTETTKVDVLTYNKQEYVDFQVDFDYQQTYNRTGIIIGGEQGVFPIGYEDGKMVAKDGVMLFLEAEGKPNAMGNFTNGYTTKSQLRKIISNANLQGFVDEEGSAQENVDAKKVHHITVVVKDKQVYMFVDGSDECAMYLTLPDNYDGGYISLFSSAPREFGVDNFVVSETITQKLPAKQKLVTKIGNKVTIDFDVDVPDATGLQAYYLKKLDKKGSLEKAEINDYWMIANGKITKQATSVGTDDAEKVAVLTYTEQKYENFIATFEYQVTKGRLMLLFGTENGKYPIYSKNGHKENGGVMLYPEANLGDGGGVCAIGDVKTANQAHRPVWYEKPYAPDYSTKNADGTVKQGTRRTMTVAVYNKHCNVYIEGYGLVSSFDLSSDYKGGYISLASTNAATSSNQYGFYSLEIQPIKDANAIKAVAANKDITVKTGTALEDLKLPTTVKVTNAKGKSVSVPVTWEARGYDGTTEGNYKFVGTLLMPSGMTNPGKLTSFITVRVRDKIMKTSAATKLWTFDTSSDLLDFKAYYIDNAKKDKPVASAGPSWLVKGGTLQRDQNRTSAGGETKKLSVLTYTGSKYTNFELEVDFTQQYAREMIMFGSKTPGQYINYEDAKSKDNPICVYVEFEGNRNALGNVVNTNYYNRTSSNVSMAREDIVENTKYYNEKNKESSVGTMHHLKLRVVGDTYTIWLDNQKTVFSGKIGEGYEGGYISLVSTAKEGKFDNLKITRLNEQGQPIADNGEVVAVDNLDIDYVKLDKPVEPTQEANKINIDVKKVVILGAPTVALLGTISTVLVLAIKKKKRK